MADKQDITLAYITNPQIRIKCRRVLSDLFTLIMNTTTSLNLRYYNAMHIVRTNCLRSITIRSNQQTFIAECVVKLLKFRNCSFREIPVTVNFSQKGNKKSIYRFRKWVINIFDGFRFFYFLFYDITFNSKVNRPKERLNLFQNLHRVNNHVLCKLLSITSCLAVEVIICGCITNLTFNN